MKVKKKIFQDKIQACRHVNLNVYAMIYFKIEFQLKFKIHSSVILNSQTGLTLKIRKTNKD